MASIYHSAVLPHLGGLPAATQAADTSLGATLQSAATLSLTSAQALDAVAKQAYVHGFHVTLVACIGVALLAAALVAWLLRPRPDMS
jgi:DHA2 family multidrug resistance protein-like MFS transporter